MQISKRARLLAITAVMAVTLVAIPAYALDDPIIPGPTLSPAPSATPSTTPSATPSATPAPSDTPEPSATPEPEVSPSATPEATPAQVLGTTNGITPTDTPDPTPGVLGALTTAHESPAPGHGSGFLPKTGAFGLAAVILAILVAIAGVAYRRAAGHTKDTAK